MIFFVCVVDFSSHMVQYHVFKFFECYFMVMIDVVFIHNLTNFFRCHVVTQFSEGILK